MVRTFGTWEEAAIYSSYMRSEGYFAALLDECVAPLYGPAAIGGIRVLLSDEPVTTTAVGQDEELSGCETPPPASPDGELVQIIRLATISLVAFGLIALAISLMQTAHLIPGGFLGILVLSLSYPALMCLMFLSLIPALGNLTKCVRDCREEGASGWLFWFVMFLLFFQILFVY